MNKRYSTTFKIQFSGVTGQRKTVAGIHYAVYPSVILVEGVHHGAIGSPTLYLADVLRASAPAWNGQPVTIHHPMKEGAYVPAALAPEKVVGHLDGVVFEDTKLRGNVHLAVAKAAQIIARLDSGSSRLEVSTGLFGEEVAEDGMWNGKRYSARLTAIQPDHLALLPDAKGACSWQDGCGVRANHNSQKERVYVPHAIFQNNNRGENAMATEEAYIPPALFQAGQRGSVSAVDRAISHINETCGAGATSKIRSMSGAELVLLGEKLAKGGQQGAPAPASSSGEESPLTMPVLFGGAR